MKDRHYDISNRPTIQFLKLAEEYINFARDTLNNKSIKSLSVVQEVLESLTKTLLDPTHQTGLKISLEKYEQARTDSLGNSESLDLEYENMLEIKESADKILYSLPLQHEKELAKQRQLRNAIVENLNKEQLNAIHVVAIRAEEGIEKETEYAQTIETKRAELRKLNAKIESNCCGGPLCNKKDILKTRSMEQEINGLIVQQDIRRTQANEARAATGENDKVGILQSKLDQKKKEIEELINTYEMRYNKIQKKADAAAKKISNIKNKMEQEILDQCREVNRNTMFDLVHLRTRISYFNELIRTIDQRDTSTRAILDVLISAREEWSKRLNSALSSFYYPTRHDQNGLQYYRAYCEWAKMHIDEQKIFKTSEFSPNEYINDIVPEEGLVKKSGAKKSALGTVHDFFPSAARSKIKSPEVLERSIELNVASSASL